jgi:hypothetical protein
MQDVIYWEQNVDAQVFCAPCILFYAPSELGDVPEVGICLAITNTYQPIYWLDLADVYQTGDVRPVWSEASAVAAVAAIIRTRSINRFVFSRIFSRVN